MKNCIYDGVVEQILYGLSLRNVGLETLKELSGKEFPTDQHVADYFMEHGGKENQYFQVLLKLEEALTHHPTRFGVVQARQAQMIGRRGQ